MSRDVAYLTPAELSARWRRSVRHVNRMAQRGQIPAVRIEGGWRFSVASVEAYEAAHTSGPAAANETPKQEASRSKEVQHATAVGGFTLSDDYEPCFPDLWPGHEPRATKKAASVHR